MGNRRTWKRAWNRSRGWQKTRKETNTPMDRRKYFKIAGVTALGSVTAMGIYPFLEAKWCRLARRTITLPNLPPAFRGMTLAFISDVHHGPFVPLAYVRDIVEIANSLERDLVLPTSDYVSQHPRYIEPGIEALETLTKWTDEDIPTDQGAAQRHQCFVNVSTPVRPQSELPRPMEPRDRPLHNPTIATQPTPMGRAALREVGTDAAATQAAAVWLGVVGPIGVQRLRTTARPARLASHRRNRVHQGLQFADIGGVGPGQSRRQRDASPIGDDVVFAPWFGPISGVWAGLLAAAQRAHRTAVNRRMRPVDPIGGLKFSQKLLMQGLPDTGLMPITQAPPAGHAATAAQFTGQVFPADAGPEHKKDAGECLAVIDWFSSGEAEPARLRWRQQRFDTVPEFVR